MKTDWNFFLFVLLATSALVSGQKSYKGHKVVTLRIENELQLQELQNLELQAGFTFLDPPVQVNMNLDIVIQPEMFLSFVEMTQMNDINFKVTTDNLQSWIDAEKPLKAAKDGFALDKFNLLEDIYQFLDEITNAHESASLHNIGESSEGRPLQVLKITKNDNNPAIFIEANIHAREWISSATAIWLINEILTSTDDDVRSVVDSVTWYILPVTNPDGYSYTHDADGDRLWRKTRSRHNIFCRGADPNRNFGYNWMMGGASKVACTDTYAGPYAFSENETKALMDFYATIADKSEAYISFHCAASMLLYPMGHTASTELVPNVEHLNEIASATVEGLSRREGRVYRYGNVVSTLYVASGSSPDHAYAVHGTPLAYTFEFRAGPDSPSRFILPPDEIVPNSLEILDALLALITKAKELSYFKAPV